VLERDGYPAGVPCFITTAQPDPEAATRFYGGLFGWTFEERMPAGSGHYFAAKLDARDVAGISSQQEGAASAAVWTTYIAVDDADETAATVEGAGGHVLVQPTDVFDAGRMAVCCDPGGAVFGVWQANEHKGAQVVNAPDSWNWSDLNTRDPAGAKAFYGAVFGWESSDLSFGDVDATMWRLPGYADVLERTDPDLRRRQADAGAPAGFEDAIGWLLPMTSEQAADDVSPHWAVTFAVDDADAVAERAEQLGGAILVAPFDAGPTRVAVLRDPQGASFSVSRYAPAS
jgi:predicted enzyme related to lactoylglutathione lyase